ncbi:hypothetical protein ABE473_18840, partial [Stenotrophomonas sp. TWI700]|uniref:hypothetical protein n=1 Tax=Stenotrophomonas sp. TWI700 TaxID=3136792 RepID=UPI003209C8F4
GGVCWGVVAPGNCLFLFGWFVTNLPTPRSRQPTRAHPLTGGWWAMEGPKQKAESRKQKAESRKQKAAELALRCSLLESDCSPLSAHRSALGTQYSTRDVSTSTDADADADAIG